MTDYVIKKKGRGYWKKNNHGYTDDINDAKIFTKKQAAIIVSPIWSDKTMHEL